MNRASDWASTEHPDWRRLCAQDVHGVAFHDVAVFKDQLILFALLALNALCYFFHALYGLWASVVVVVLVLMYSLTINYRHMAARHFSWATIFVVLLALFHLGYYLPARIGLIDELDFMPSVSSVESEVAILLFGAAVLAFEAGVLSGCRRAWNRRHRQRQPQLDTLTDSGARLLGIGLPILALGLLLLVIFVVQQGGLRKIFLMSYADYNIFRTESDSRFEETGIQLFPVGILITYVGLLLQGARKKPVFCLRSLASAFVLWLLLVGNRGAALLLIVGFIYAGHLCKRPVPWKTLVLVGIFSTVAIPVIAAYRNVIAGDRLTAARDANLVPLAAAVEMGQTYRTLVGFAEFFWKDHYPLMMGKSYAMAVPQLLPNLGLSKGHAPGGDYYRSAMWITEKLDPATARASSGGLGSTGIGEPYANFGYGGVVALFWSLGLGIGGLEQYFLLTRSAFTIAVICGVFAPINWYVRDDFYGTFRPVAWAILAITFLFYLSKPRPRFEQAGVPFDKAAARRSKPAI